MIQCSVGTTQNSQDAIAAVNRLTASLDKAPPTVSNAVITVLNEDNSSSRLQLSWHTAFDNTTKSTNLVYGVYLSTVEVGNSPDWSNTANVKKLGESADISSFSVTDLSPSTEYHFMVTVKDERGNKTNYQEVSYTTPADTAQNTLTTLTADGASGSLDNAVAASVVVDVNLANSSYTTVDVISDFDTTAPSVSSATITPSSVTPTTVLFTWIKAIDDRSAQSALQYRIYYSTVSSQVDTLAHINAGGATEFGSGFSTDINSLTVTGLTQNTAYYFNVVVKDEASNMLAYTILPQATPLSADTTAPSLSSATITPSSLTSTTVPLSWTKATDDRSAQSALQYRIYYSTTSSQVDTLAHINAGGATAFGSGFSTDINSLTVTGLTQNTAYYFNVVVKDESSNMLAYTMLPQATPLPADTTVPSVSSATITPSSVTSTTVPLSWTKATDDRSAQSTLQYRIYYSTTSSQVDTLAHINAGGATGFGSGFSTDINSLTVTGLTQNTAYYFNVVVKDESSNMLAYTMLPQATPVFADADGDGVADGSDICSGWNDILVGGAGFDINVDVDGDGLTVALHTTSCPSSVTGYVATASTVADSNDASHVGYSYNSSVKTELSIGVDVDGNGTISGSTNVNVISNLNQWFDFAAKCSNGVTTTCTGNYYLANDLDFGTLAGRTATTNNIPADAGSASGKFTITNATYVLGQAGTSSATYAFQGSLHGGDHKLKNLIVDLHASNFVGGIANNTYMARIQHITLQDSYVKGTLYTGGIVGYSQYTDLLYVHNVNTTVESFLTTDNRNSVGGIAGQSYGVASGKGAISYATNSGSVKCQSQICYNAGGIVGYFQSQTMDHSSNTGTVNPDNYGNSNSNSGEIAGLAGLSTSATIINSFNTGIIKGRGSMGGITGYAAGSNTFSKVYNTGAIQGYYGTTSAYGMQCGGIVGYLSSSGINNAYNTGAVSCGAYTGGITGYPSNNSTTTVQYTVNIGTVTNLKPSDTNAGGIMGAAPGVSSGTVTDNYYWSTAYASDKSTNSTSLSQSSDFASLSTFTNFSSAIWQIQNSLGGSITSRPTLIAIPE